MLLRSIYKNAFELAAFALLSIGLIAVFHWLTKDKIQAEMQAKLARTLSQIVPPSKYNNDVYHECIVIDSAGVLHPKKSTKFYRMTQDDTPVATVFTVTTTQGYNGAIEIILGIYEKDDSIAGVRVVQHNETPGLGDKLEIHKSDWITQFSGVSLNDIPADQWKVKKDGGQFDAFTGATITPRAALSAIAAGLTFYQANKPAIFNRPVNCGEIGESSN